ncbi:MAG TPA: M23 family metallopeptidase [Flavobacterium sp.]|jgi:hypothetical protein
MNILQLTISFCLLFSFNLFAQNPYPQDYFRSPLDIPLQLSGNFGELRSNHFHAGFDFRTQQREGLTVYAAAAGYVSRIKISAYGYGKAIYVDHPNGYTTVYGHLQKGSSVIEAYIKAEQYKQESFDIEVFPKPGELVVSKGDLIAFSGNTGGSGGPHLHFEIRETLSEKVLNPLLFGFNTIIIDTKKPVITDLVVYPIDGEATVNQSKLPVVVGLSQQADGNYIASKVLASGKIGFGISAYDSNNYSTNKNGIYKAESFLNGNLSFGYQFDIFAFDESRYINALIDYPRFKRTGQRVQRLFMKQPYNLNIIRTGEEGGTLTITPNKTQLYRIEVSDFNNNKSTISIPVEYSAAAADNAPLLKPASYLIRSAKDHSFEKDNFSVFIPANTFYEDTYIDFDSKDGVYTFGNDYIPVHSSFTVTIKDDRIPSGEADKTFIASVDGSRLAYNNTKRKGNEFTTYTKNLGQYKLVKDTIAPKIRIAKPIEGKWLNSYKTLELSISDNLAGIRDFDAYINGKWVLFEYDYKTAKIRYNFSDAMTAQGRNELKVVVSDNVGNSAIFETHFFRS